MRDKLLHAESSALIVVLVAKFLPIWIAVVLSLMAGIAKEIWDKKHGGCCDMKDIYADCAGVIIGFCLTLI